MTDEEQLCILNTAHDCSKFFEKAAVFAQRTIPAGLVTAAMLSNLESKGVVLPQSLLDILLAPNNAGQYLFIPADQDQLNRIPEWQAVSPSIQKKIISCLWHPSHLADLALKDIYQNPDLCEVLYGQIGELIKRRRIRFKEGSRPLPSGFSQKGPTSRADHLAFLAAMDAMDKTYQDHRRTVLQWQFFEETAGFFNSMELMMAIARDVPMRELEIFYAESAPEQKKRVAMESCHRSGARMLIRTILGEGAKLEAFLADLRIGVSSTALCSRYGHKKTLAAWTLYTMLETLSFDQTLFVLGMEDDKKKSSIAGLYKENIKELVPRKLVRILGPEAVARLKPGSLAVLIRALREEERMLAGLASPLAATPPPSSLLSTVLAKLRLTREQAAPAPKKPTLATGIIMHGLGAKTIAKLSPGKLQYVLGLRDPAFLKAIRHGFAQILAHVKTEKIIPLARYYNTPLWDVIMALRFINQIDNEILEKMDYLAQRSYLDVAFARFLSKIFQNKLGGLRLYHLEEVNQNREVIMVLKEKFLALKRGMVRIAVKHLHLIKQHKELVELFFSKTAEQLEGLFNDPFRMGKLVQELEAGPRRKIVYDN